jgi:Flp pilus assembly protein TadG
VLIPLHAMHRASGLVRRLLASTSGASAIEFALTLPLLLTLTFFGTEIAYEASVNMEMSQIALSAADNASRLEQTNNSAVTPTVTEADVASVMNGVLKQGASYNFQTNGRVILSSLETDPSTGKQYIHWQRCIGNLSVQSAYGNDTTRNGLSGAAITSMGSGTVKVSAPAASNNQAVMFVELYYNYNGLFGTMFLPQQHFGHEGAFITRDSRNLSAGLTGTNTSRCT